MKKMAFNTSFLFILQSIFSMDISVAEPIIDVSPAEIKLGFTSTLDINCTFSLDNHPGMAALISLVLSRANAVGQQFQDLAAITEFSPDSVNLLTQEKVSAIGVNRQTGETILHLRWDYPTAQQAGVYQCSAHGVDNIGYNVELTNTSLVTVDEADLNDILKKLKQMEMHESVLDQQIQSLQNEKISMQQNIQNLNTNISYLENIVDLLQPVALLQPVGKYQNSSYYVSKEGYDDVHKGIDVCTSLGGHLAVINDQDEFNAIQGFLVAASGFTHVVISGTDEDEEGTWVITNSNTPLPFTFWGQGRPTHWNSSNCVMLTGNNWHMIDDGCYFNRVLNYVRFMCELPST